MSLRTPPMSVFYLIDLALYPQLSQQLFAIDESPVYERLYLQTAYARYAQQGPILFSPSNGSAHVAAARWVQQGAAIALHTRATLSEVAKHYRQLTHVERQTGPPALFRYADSRIYVGLVSGLTEGETHALLGPINVMNGVANGEAWQLESPAPDDEPPGKFKLTADHEQAFQRKREQTFCQQLASDHGVALSQAQQWLQQMKALPLTTEYARWEGCQILAASDYPEPLSSRHMQQLSSYGGSWQALLGELKMLTSEQAPLVDTDGDDR
ncbi:DUF4123 domain-containing protein [Halomonas alkaliantarctica]|uniref:DUF4123 domain-containing protein n=1 Tax=Halomonas alkaliantarctica TaxID=232346 RepID=A0ABY8LQS3_9GAMM|nr:DUF4123 domain-containing protein [Halomonas alkaliantarctica]WGI26765.1 DUF4123 domain-containing protein [Halomonas alkaliantarctica]